MNKLIIGAVIVLVAAAGWFFVSPLFINEEIDEAPPAALQMPTRSEVMAMADNEREVLREQLMADAADQGRRVDEGMDMAGPVQLAAGQFVDADAIHKGSGQALIYDIPDQGYVLRLEDLQVTNGPALVVLLARHPNPTNAADVKTGYIKLGKLKGNIGNQNYTIPAEIDVTTFGSVVIWCELFDVLFSPAALKLY